MNLAPASTLVLIALGAACASGASGEARTASTSPSSVPTLAPEPGEEPYLANLRQLTFEGQNAEAYFSPDDERLVFQATTDSVPCDQIFTMRLDGSELRRISNGDGVTTCAYFVYPDASGFIYSSTHLVDPACPPRPDYSRGYVWPIHAGYDVFRVDSGGGDPVRLTQTPGYDAEATFARDGSRIVFTSVRDGDLEMITYR